MCSAVFTALSASDNFFFSSLGSPADTETARKAASAWGIEKMRGSMDHIAGLLCVSCDLHSCLPGRFGFGRDSKRGVEERGRYDSERDE